MPKCQWCKENGEKETMVCEETPTGKFNKNGSEKMIRRYYHFNCHNDFKEDKEFKMKEANELDELYQYLLKLHNLKTLDSRMFEKIQDLRNGTIKFNNKKIKKYKDGVPYSLMLLTYQHLQNNIAEIIRKMSFQTKWNEFSYIFGMVSKNVNELKEMSTIRDSVGVPQNINVDSIEVIVSKKDKKKDDLDISQFL